MALAAGAWGAGSRLAATSRLLASAGYLPVVLCGRNERLRRELSRSPEVWAIGWEPDLPGLLAASRAVVDNAAGQTALEALAAGVPVVGYRPVPGHGLEGVRHMAALGVSDHARDAEELVRLLDTLTAPGAARDRRIAAGRRLFIGDAAACLAEVGRVAGAAHGAAGD